MALSSPVYISSQNLCLPLADSNVEWLLLHGLSNQDIAFILRTLIDSGGQFSRVFLSAVLAVSCYAYLLTIHKPTRSIKSPRPAIGLFATYGAPALATIGQT